MNCTALSIMNLIPNPPSEIVECQYVDTIRPPCRSAAPLMNENFVHPTSMAGEGRANFLGAAE